MEHNRPKRENKLISLIRKLENEKIPQLKKKQESFREVYDQVQQKLNKQATNTVTKNNRQDESETTETTTTENENSSVMFGRGCHHLRRHHRKRL